MNTIVIKNYFVEMQTSVMVLLSHLSIYLLTIKKPVVHKT